MPTWAQLQANVYTITNRPAMVNETTHALKQAIRAAHKAGKFWRDLTEVTVTGLSTTTAVQTIPLASISANFRQAAYVKYPDVENGYMTPITIDDQLDHNGLVRQDVYWGFGTNLMIRAANVASSYVVAAYLSPDLTFAGNVSNSTDWIFTDYQELVELWAASTVLSMVGEQDIKSRCDQMVQILLQDLIHDNLEVQGR